MIEDLLNAIQKMRQEVIEAGGQPDTLRISKKKLENSKIFGMKILVVDDLPNDTFLLVSDDKNIRPIRCIWCSNTEGHKSWCPTQEVKL